MSYYCFENARSGEQVAEMRRLEAAGICLFCPEGLARHTRQPLLLSTRHWSATPNAFPYQGTSVHILLVPHQHACDLLDLPEEVRSDFWAALGGVAEKLGLASYGLGVRNGDCAFTGATIRHVHAHVLVGETGRDDAPPVRMRFSSHPGRQGSGRQGSGR